MVVGAAGQSEKGQRHGGRLGEREATPELRAEGLAASGLRGAWDVETSRSFDFIL